MPSAQTDQAAQKESQEESPDEPQEEISPMPSAQAQASPKPNAKKTKKEDLENPKDIYLNFENTDLSNFINYMAETKKLNLIPDKSLEGAKVSLTIRDPLTIDGAWNIFLTVLEMAGFTIVQAGDVHKVIPKDQKTRQPLPAYINVPASTLPESDLTIRYVAILQNLNVEAIRELLDSMLSDKHELIAQKEVNGFIITDKSLNIKSAMKVIQELDSMGLPETIVVIKLQSANAVDVKELLNSLMKDQEAASPLARFLGKPTEGTTKYFPAGTKIIAEERTNSLILLGAPEPIKKIEDFITNHVDTSLKAVESPLHIYELQYTDASQIRDILQEVTAAPEGGPGQQASKYGAIRGGVKYFRTMIFTVDKDGNRLIVSSTDKEDWDLLRKTIEDLDKPQPQIAVEAMIVSIDANDTKQLGGAIRNKKHGQLGIGVDFQSAAPTGSPSLQTDSTGVTPISLLGNMISQLLPAQGSSVFSFGTPGTSTNPGIWGIFNTLKTQTSASILSQPFLTIANKTKASIEVGQNIQVPQEKQGDTTGLTGFVPLDANTKIEIEPTINLDGVIRMQVTVDINEFTNPMGTASTKRNLVTNVTVADGQVLVLGGFVKTQITESKQKTPILGDIPIIGWLFKGQQRIITKQYIFIFMTPTIIKPRQTPGMNLYTKMKLHQVTDELEDNIKTTKTRDPIFNWFFNADKENYSHKIIDYANARYQPTNVDIKNDPYYRSQTKQEEKRLKRMAAQESAMPPVESKTRLNMPPAQSTTKLDMSPAELSMPSASTESMKPTRSESTTKLDMPPAELGMPSANKQTQKQMVTPSQAAPQEREDTKTRRTQEIIQESVNQKKISTGQAQENNLQEQRQKLRELLAQQPQDNQQQTTQKEQLKEFIAPLPKRQQMKEFIAQQPDEIDETPQPTLNVDPSKRRKLKEFLSQADVT